MAKPSKKMREIELHEDAWERFEHFIKDVAKAGPQHRTKAAKSPGDKGVVKSAAAARNRKSPVT